MERLSQRAAACCRAHWAAIFGIAKRERAWTIGVRSATSEEGGSHEAEAASPDGFRRRRGGRGDGSIGGRATSRAIGDGGQHRRDAGTELQGRARDRSALSIQPRRIAAAEDRA